MATDLLPEPRVAPRKQSSPDHLIDRELRRTQLQVRLVDIAATLVVWLVAVLASLLVLVLCDHWLVSLGSGGRWLALISLVGGSSYFFATQLGPLVLRRINSAYAAKVIEDAEPSLKNSLLNFLLLRGNSAGVPDVVVDALRERAASDLSRSQVDHTVDRTPLIRLGYVLCGVMIVFAAYKLLSPKDPFRTVARVLAPWADITRPSRVQIVKVQPGDADVYQGQSVTITAEVTGARSKDAVELRYSTADGQTVDAVVPLTSVAGSQYSCQLPPGPSDSGLQQDVLYRVKAGDAESQQYRLKMLPSPRIEVERVELHYPAYTKRAAQTLERQGDIRAVEGTQVTVHAKANQEIATAYIEFDPSAEIARRNNTLTMQAEGTTAKAEFRLERLRDGAAKHTTYQVRLLSHANLKNDRPTLHRIEALADLAPEIEILSPMERRLELPADRTLKVELRGRDPDFGLCKIVLELSKGEEKLPPVTLLEDREGKLGPTNPNLIYVVVPQKLGLQPGDDLLLVGVAEDNRHDAAGELAANVSRTDRYVIHITAPEVREPKPSDKPMNDAADTGEDRPPMPGEQEKPKPSETPKKPEKPEGDKPEKPQPKKPGPEESKPETGENKPNPGEKKEEKKPGESTEDKEKPGEKSKTEQQQGKGGAGGGKSEEQQEGADDGDGSSSGSEGKPGGSKSKSGDKPKGGSQTDSSEGTEGDDNTEGDQSSGGDREGKPNDKGGKKGGQKKPAAPGENPGDAADTGSEGTDSGEDNSEGTGTSSPGKPNANMKAGEKKGGDDVGSENRPKLDSEAIEQINKELEKNPSLKEKLQEQKKSQNPGEKSTESKPGSGEEKPGGEKPAGAQGTKPQPKPGTGEQPKPGEQEGTGGSSAQEKPGDKPGEGKPMPQPGDKPGDKPMPDEKPMPGEGDNAAGNQNSTEGASPGSNKPGKPMNAEGKPKEPKENGPAQKPGEGDQGSPGSGSKPEKNNPAGQPNRTSQDKPKNPKPEGGENTSDSPSASSDDKKQSSSTGDSEGDKSGGGKQGAGQQAKNEGHDTPGSSSSSDEGAGKSGEPGDGEKGTKGGQGPKSERPTGKSGKEEGPGSKSKPGEKGTKPDASKSGNSDGSQGGAPTNLTKDPNKGRPSGDPPKGGGLPSDGEPIEGSSKKVDVADTEAENLEFAKKSTDLALQYLKDQKDKPDPELLKKLGWTKDDLNAFLQRWESMKNSAKEGGEAKDELNDAYRSLGLRPGAEKRRNAAAGDDATRGNRDSGARSEPPPGYADQFKAFRKSAGQK